jgi:hypothetical protein
VEELSFREAILPPSLQELRQKLGRKAKQQKRYRFYSLYALVCRRDVLQAAVLLILEPIFEADFEDCSYGFRPRRSAHDALGQILQHLKRGQTAVYDADLAGYFDSIPQDKLAACLRMRVVDGSVLGRIRQWLQAPVVEPPKDGKPPTVKRNDRGTPQGGVLSPLLANVYLHWFDHLFERGDGPAQWAKAKLIRYADDFVVMARYISPRLRDWIGLGYPRKRFRHLNHFVRYRLGRHLQRRSQRGWRAREGLSLYAHLNHRGLITL